jgi:long-chain acyl-CoA synthetase
MRAGQQLSLSDSLVRALPRFHSDSSQRKDGRGDRSRVRTGQWLRAIIGDVIDHNRAARAELTAPGAPFAIEEIEVRCVRIKAFAVAPPDLRTIWAGASATHADKLYMVYENERYTYSEVAAQVRSLAHHLRSVHGVGSGDRVALALRNYPEWVVGYWAIIATGAAVVGMNAWWTGAEMEFGLADSTPKVLIADDDRLERVLPNLDALRANHALHIISVRTDRELPSDAARWTDVVQSESAPIDLPTATIDPDDDACIFYTSGTTGFPKGAQLTHRGCVSNLMNLAFMVTALTLADAKAVAAGDLETPTNVLPPPVQTVSLLTTPLFHVTANNCGLHPATAGGGAIVLMYKWDAGRALELIEREGITGTGGVPTMSRELLMHPDWSTRDTSSLRGMSGGGAPLQPDLVEKIAGSVKNGAPGTGYGLTETCGIVTAISGHNFIERPKSCGTIVPTLDAKLIDENGNDVKPGPEATGELCVKGAVVIKGYLNRPEATADAIRDGWFRTGDIARIDDEGYVYIVDRAKDMVLRGGENVYCSEVEAAIYLHPDVVEAAVFSVPDDRLGEDVGAAVLVRPGSVLDSDGLRTFLSDQLAKHKIPGRVWFLDEAIPRNANGKFVKRDLRAKLLAN